MMDTGHIRQICLDTFCIVLLFKLNQIEYTDTKNKSLIHSVLVWYCHLFNVRIWASAWARVRFRTKTELTIEKIKSCELSRWTQNDNRNMVIAKFFIRRINKIFYCPQNKTNEWANHQNGWI